jgi:hypothetical protein
MKISTMVQAVFFPAKQSMVVVMLNVQQMLILPYLSHVTSYFAMCDFSAFISKLPASRYSFVWKSC